MRIVVVSNAYPPAIMGGYELGCDQMVRALRGRGHDVCVVTARAGVDRCGDDLKRILELAPVYNGAVMAAAEDPLQRHYHLRSALVNSVNIGALTSAIESFSPDVAYVWNLLGLGAFAILGLLGHQGIPWVWHLMDQIPRQIARFGTTGPEVGAAFDTVFPGRYIACSSHVLGEIQGGGVDLGDRVEIVPNWITGDAAALRQSFYRTGSLRIMSASGVLCEPKGTDILIDVADRLRRDGLGDFVIDLYGVEDDSRFRATVAECALHDHVRFMGARAHAEMIRIYAGYDVFAFPTWSREPFAFAPLEAAAAGCLPLMTDTCGNAEWAIDGVDCLKAPRSAEAFAARLAKVLRGEVDLAALGRRAQRIAWRDFHISRVVPRVERTLQAADADRRGARGSPQEFLRLARYAEGLLEALLREASD